MSESAVEHVFDEFALAYRRGERPDVREYLERVPEGPEREALADLIDRFLVAVPAREPSEEEIVLLEARLEREPALLVLRRRRRLRREAVVDALVRALGLDPRKRDKVAGYYHQLETGLLDPEPVDRSVWEALAEVLRANVRALAARVPPPPAALAYRRAEQGFVLQARLGERPPSPAAEAGGLDEVDRLFTGAS
ncbi:MAG TPA: hypothetical protein VNJ46_04875 [Gaiellaceae bacterium]|nr:hypothetical protein [Gaiellaceae bacterium]